jgi:O-antigen/teichoic acid export membrane protein
MVSDELPKIISGVLLGPVATGVYFLARRLFDFLTEVLLAPLFSVAFSSFSRLQDNPAEMQRLFNGYIRFALLLAAPAFIGFAIVAPILLPLVFGEKWKTVVIPAQIMMALGIERAMVPITAGVLAAIGRTSVLLILGLSYACLLALFAVAGARFGVPGIASGLVLCNFLSMFLVIGLAQRLSPIDTVSGLVRNWPVIIATILMFLATETAFQFTQAWPPIVQVGALVSIGAASFLASMWIFGRSLLRDVVDVALSLRRRPPAPASPP